MALETSPSALWREIQAAEKKRDEHLESLKDHVSSYVGPWYKGGSDTSEFDPENTFFEFLSHAIPQWVSTAPQFMADTRRPSVQELVAEAIEWGLNRWAKDSELVDTLQEIAYDYGFRWGCGIVSQSPRHEFRDMDDPVQFPQFARLSPHDFGWDSAARTFRQARLMFHRYPIDHDDLVLFAKDDAKLPADEREGWDLKAIESLTPGQGMDDWDQDADVRNQVNRNQLLVYEVWIPEIEVEDSEGPEEGFHGTIFTLAHGTGVGGEDGSSVGGAPTEIRDPRPFYGPRWGPYVLFGAWVVPDQAEPLSSIVASAGQHEQLNQAARAADRAAKSYKRLVLVSGDDPDLQTTIQDGPDQFVFPVRNTQNLQGKVVNLEVGGLTQQFISLLQLYQDRTNRTLSLDEVQRGNVQGTGTATEVSAAVDAAQARRGHEQARFLRGVKQLAKTVAWYLFHDDKVIFPLGREANEEFEDQLEEGQDVFFMGGNFDTKSGATFDDLELEIEALSMERTTQASLRRRTGFMVEFLAGLGPQLPQLAQMGFDIPKILRMVGDGENIPYLDDIVDMEQLAEVSQSQVSQLPIPMLARQAGAQGTTPGFFGGGTKRGPAQASQSLAAPQGAPQAQQPQPQGATPAL